MATAAQASLFPSSAETTHGLFAHVVFNRPLDQAFTYAVPPHLADDLAVGKRVLAPFGRGNHKDVGYCVELTRRPPERRVKVLARVLDAEPLLTQALLRLTRWMADYYVCGWGQVLDAVIPAGVKEQAGMRWQTLLQAVPLGTTGVTPVPLGRVGTPGLPGIPKLTPKQARVLDMLRQYGQPVAAKTLAQQASCGLAVCWSLVDKGYAVRTVERVPHFRPVPPASRRCHSPDSEQPLELNPDQLKAQSALEQALNAGEFRAFLLHGVTGSGKTEVYLQAIQHAVRQGRQALVLVPEISLTPQTIQRFRGRFPHVAVLHSHLGDAERGWYWRQIVASGGRQPSEQSPEGPRVQVIVGARSAVFAPAPHLGLIVVDEEHEGSFKQESTPRYHGRDVAVMRARLEGIPIVLGSATPSLESWHNAQRGQYTLLRLPARVLNRPLPRVGLIDMRHEPLTRGRYRAISPTLERAIRAALDKNGQVILLLNRRGFDTHIQCPSCGHVVKCRFCDVALTHHRQKEVAMCHYCGYEQQPPERCSECGLSQVRYWGQGTEKLEAELAQKFPGIPAERMDSDSMRRPGSHARVLDAFRRGEVRILFGTQMIAKGLDFPNVTLVGVVNADTALYVPDFRSPERTFQLLAQVAGRTGRGPHGGKVLVQTFNPQHPCISLAAMHDYLKFAELELRARKEHGYPPYARMARVILRGKEQEKAAAFAEQFAQAFRAALAAALEQSKIKNQKSKMVRLLGPAEATLFRLKGYYRYHFQLQSPSAAALHELLKQVLSRARVPKGIDLTVDVDPLSML